MSAGTPVFFDENYHLSRLVDPPPYTVTITDADLLWILNIIEESLMRTDDFIDMDYGKHLREGTRKKLEARRAQIRELLARLRGIQDAAEAAAFASLEPTN